jgi:hypothetical protein
MFFIIVVYFVIDDAKMGVEKRLKSGKKTKNVFFLIEYQERE